ncbi:MAG: Rieske 2Fe-2S domain-containing protein [Steroidobacteraceae bacterium]
MAGGSTWGEAVALDNSAPFIAEAEGYHPHRAGRGYAHAFEDRCTHDDASLDDAEIDPDDPAGPVIVCPRHGARFCLRDGAAMTPPAYEPVQVFPVRERTGRVEVQLP